MPCSAVGIIKVIIFSCYLLVQHPYSHEKISQTLQTPFFFPFIFWEILRILTLTKTFQADFTDTFVMPLREEKKMFTITQSSLKKTPKQNKKMTKTTQF